MIGTLDAVGSGALPLPHAEMKTALITERIPVGSPVPKRVANRA
jgi:hypothetical protein